MIFRIIIFFLWIPVTGLTPSTVIDLKTHLGEKIDLLPLKIGTAYYLNKWDYTTLSIDEDYAVWLKNYSKKKTGKAKYHIRFQVAITRPSVFLEKDAYTKANFSFSYDLEKLEDIEVDDSLLQLLKTKLKHFSRQSYQEAILGGEQAAKFVDSFIRQHKKQKAKP